MPHQVGSGGGHLAQGAIGLRATTWWTGSCYSYQAWHEAKRVLAEIFRETFVNAKWHFTLQLLAALGDWAVKSPCRRQLPPRSMTLLWWLN